MDDKRFDDLLRGLATQQSRRKALTRFGRAGLAAALASIGLGAARTAAQVTMCAEEDCPCRTGAPASCIPGLVCCPNNIDLPGGSGTCVAPSLCFGGICSGDAVACPASCSWGGNCLGCCSGYCGSNGLCGGGPCRGPGCSCITGTLAPCEEGLACCPIIEGLPGGPGVCALRGVCD